MTAFAIYAAGVEEATKEIATGLASMFSGDED